MWATRGIVSINTFQQEVRRAPWITLEIRADPRDILLNTVCVRTARHSSVCSPELMSCWLCGCLLNQWHSNNNSPFHEKLTELSVWVKVARTNNNKVLVSIPESLLTFIQHSTAPGCVLCCSSHYPSTFIQLCSFSSFISSDTKEVKWMLLISDFLMYLSIIRCYYVSNVVLLID